MNTFFVAAFLGACVATNATLLADWTHIDDGVQVESLSVTQGPRGAIITINVWANPGPSGEIDLYATSPGDRLQSVIVNILQHPFYMPEVHNIVLKIAPDPNITSASIAYVGSISPNTNRKGDLFITSINVAGTIGSSTNPLQDSIIAQSINNITASGDISATLQSTGSAYVFGDVATVRSTGGSILGQIIANRTIATIDAGGSLGTSTSPLVIRAGGGVSRIVCNSGFVDIQANVGTGSTGTLGRLETRTGDLSGIIKAHSLAGGTNPNEEAIKVAGALRANVEVQTSIDKSIRCGTSSVR